MPMTNAMVPPETPGTTSAIPMNTPLSRFMVKSIGVRILTRCSCFGTLGLLVESFAVSFFASISVVNTPRFLGVSSSCTIHSSAVIDR